MSGYQVYELRDSESGSVDTSNFESGEVWNVTKKYLIGQCYGGMGEVKDAIADYAPLYWSTGSGYWKRTNLSIKGVGRACFECTADYVTLQPAASEGGDDGNDDSGGGTFVPGQIAWDTTGNTEHRTSAISERVVGSDDHFYGAINVNGTSVGGIDVVVPGMKYTETWIMPAAMGLSTGYAKKVYELTGSVNKEKFRAFEEGEALFLGASASWSGDQPYTTITYQFQIRANDPDFYFEGELPHTTKEGWEYPWVVYRQEAATSGILVQKPRCVVIDEVYKKKDWAGLGIAGGPGRSRTGSRPTAANAAAAVQSFVN